MQGKKKETVQASFVLSLYKSNDKNVNFTRVTCSSIARLNWPIVGLANIDWRVMGKWPAASVFRSFFFCCQCQMTFPCLPQSLKPRESLLLLLMSLYLWISSGVFRICNPRSLAASPLYSLSDKWSRSSQGCRNRNTIYLHILRKLRLNRNSIVLRIQQASINSKRPTRLVNGDKSEPKVPLLLSLSMLFLCLSFSKSDEIFKGYSSLLPLRAEEKKSGWLSRVSISSPLLLLLDSKLNLPNRGWRRIFKFNW